MRSLILSALLVVATTAAGQGTKPKPTPSGADEAVLFALRNHPDIKLAEAKRQMAEAELEQARLLVAQRVTSAYSKVEQAKATLAITEQSAEIKAKLRERAIASMADINAAQLEVIKAKAALAAAEMELKAAKGETHHRVGAASDPRADLAVANGMKWLSRMQIEGATAKPIPEGSVVDKLKLLIDKPVKVEVKNANLNESTAALLKSVGEPSFLVKVPDLGKIILEPKTLSFSGEMPFSAAFQLILDEINSSNIRYDVYVREYGLLIAIAEDAPKDAITLTEFARQVRAAKGEKK